MNVRNETIKLTNNQKEFLTIRDTLCQIIYNLLFNYIVKQINNSMNIQSSYYIGILDIFGFEIFKDNGFEQLCINYTNERLQGLFNKYIFELEQLEYENEGIDWKNITYPSNKNILKLMDNRKLSIFSLLLEQCILKNGSDKALYSIILKNLRNNEYINIKNLDVPKEQFGIKHYAGEVCYKTKGFINKNRNLCDSRIVKFINNGNDIMKEFDLNIYGFENKDSVKNKAVISQFKIQLQELISVISKTNQHYIRCIKPNDDNLPNKFNHPRVFEQLKYCGVLEAIKIARAGYPVRLKKNAFIQRFYPKINSMSIPLNKENIETFINSIHLDLNQYQIGITKIFLKKQSYEDMVIENKKVMFINATFIQKYVRYWKCYKIYRKLKKIIILMQYKWRKFLLKKHNAK